MNTSWTYIFALVLSLFAIQSANSSEPIKLANKQLDLITAGFLEIQTTANAAALGTESLTDTATNTVVSVGAPSNDGTILTHGHGTAVSIAIGDEVFTSASAGFATDEEVLSVSTQTSILSGLINIRSIRKNRNSNNQQKGKRLRIKANKLKKIRPNGRKNSNKRRIKNPNIKQIRIQTVQINVVTRTNTPSLSNQ